jgi:hypothetical protein
MAYTTMKPSPPCPALSGARNREGKKREPDLHVLVAHGAVFLLQKSQEENKSEQLAAILKQGGPTRTHLSRSV